MSVWGKAARKVMAEDLARGAERARERQQDALDGAALRRLREALPDSVAVNVVLDDGGPLVVARDGDYPELPVYYRGATIAEAADKCREAVVR